MKYLKKCQVFHLNGDSISQLIRDFLMQTFQDFIQFLEFTKRSFGCSFQIRKWCSRVTYVDCNYAQIFDSNNGCTIKKITSAIFFNINISILIHWSNDLIFKNKKNHYTVLISVECKFFFFFIKKTKIYEQE